MAYFPEILDKKTNRFFFFSKMLPETFPSSRTDLQATDAMIVLFKSKHKKWNFGSEHLETDSFTLYGIIDSQNFET